jgi:hypothetical protein
MLESFRSLRKLSDGRTTWIQQLTKDYLTTKLTKDTKGSDNHDFKLRDLRAFVVKTVFASLVVAPPREGCYFALSSLSEAELMQ